VPRRSQHIALRAPGSARHGARALRRAEARRGGAQPAQRREQLRCAAELLPLYREPRVRQQHSPLRMAQMSVRIRMARASGRTSARRGASRTRHGRLGAPNVRLTAHRCPVGRTNQSSAGGGGGRGAAPCRLPALSTRLAARSAPPATRTRRPGPGAGHARRRPAPRRRPPRARAARPPLPQPRSAASPRAPPSPPASTARAQSAQAARAVSAGARALSWRRRGARGGVAPADLNLAEAAIDHRGGLVVDLPRPAPPTTVIHTGISSEEQC